MHPNRPDIWTVVDDIKKRLRGLEGNAIQTCPQWTELAPAVTLVGGLTNPSGYDSDQFDATCETGLPTPGTLYSQGELKVVFAADVGSAADANCHYAIGAVDVGAVSDVVGYGRCYADGGTIVYPALLLSSGSVQITGLADAGGGATPTLARPDFPFTFAADDVLFEGHYAYWGHPAL